LNSVLSVFFLALVTCVAQQPATTQNEQPTHGTYLKLAGEVEEALHKDVLGVWFPNAVDNEHGGFHSHFAHDWKKLPSDGKFSVFQGRMTWVASQVVMREPQRKDEFVPIVRHGVEFLQNVMWDKQDGGFFWGLDDAGNITPQFGDHKELYGIGFCIYGAAAAYQATHDQQALELAKKGFAWIDQHAHDAKNGGYFEWLTRDGTPVPMRSVDGRVESNGIGPIGFKSMNTHIHLLEAFTQLYEVWPDPTLRARLEELLAIVRDKISGPPGVMNLYFTDAWQAIPDHDSYGHDVETAYLMLETDEALHKKASEATERMAKMLVDHALAYGWDVKNGGFFHEGTTLGEPENTSKEWWVQYEGLNALLLMHERYGKQNPVYFERFLAQWDFIRDHTIDAQNRGDFNLTTAEGKPLTEDKGSIWKAAYHDGRALWNVSERLRRLAKAE
jgi:mannobiose 2-epimerase